LQECRGTLKLHLLSIHELTAVLGSQEVVL
jgi:hypothetical protein